MLSLLMVFFSFVFCFCIVPKIYYSLFTGCLQIQSLSRPFFHRLPEKFQCCVFCLYFDIEINRNTFQAIFFVCLCIFEAQLNFILTSWYKSWSKAGILDWIEFWVWKGIYFKSIQIFVFDNVINLGAMNDQIS